MRRLHDILLLLAAAAAASARLNAGEASSLTPPPWPHELDSSYAFAQYLIDFGKSYDDPEEYSRRSAIFSANLERILSHNHGRLTADGDIIGGGYVMGVNAYTDREGGELPMGYNKLMHPYWRDQLKGTVSRTERLLADTNMGEYSKKPDFSMDEVSSLPESVDWSAQGKVNPTIPYQGPCGSCWSFAATAAVESHLAIKTGEGVMSLSEQNMLQCAPDPEQCGGSGDCTGSTVELGLDWIADQSAKKTGGMYTIEDLPYSSSTSGRKDCAELTRGKKPVVGIEGWTKLESNNYKAVMNALAKVGPLAVAVDASDWGLYHGGVFDTKGTTVNHAVLLVGYGVDDGTQEKYWKVRNSWGDGFGEDGYIRIKRSDSDDEVCGMDDDPLVGMACALDENGNKVDVMPVKVCGTSAILIDVSYPVGPFKIE